MIDAPSDLVEQLASRLSLLEQRVAALECRAQVPAVSAAVPGPGAPASLPASPAPGSVFSILGIALLGIAGAYVLRAIAAAELMPRAIVAAIAFLYSLGWLFAGSRAVPRRAFAGVLYSATSILILSPMLWEMFLRFHAISGLVCAGTLALWAAAATALAFRPAQSAVFIAAYLGASLSVLALSIATHEAAAFAALLIAMAAACELLRLRGRSPAIRGLVLLAADFAVWMVLFIYRSPAQARADYPALPTAIALFLGCALLALASAAIAVWVLGQRGTISAFDIVQASIAFLLAAAAVLWLLPSSGPLILGLLCLALAAACYWAAFGPLRRIGNRRNFRFFAAWSAVLLPAGLLLSLPSGAAAAVLSIAAIVATLAGNGMHSRVMRLHAVVYLAASAAISGLFVYAVHCLIGGSPPPPAWPVLLAAAAAITQIAIARAEPSDDLSDYLLELIPLLLAAMSAASLAWRALIAAGAAAFVLGPPHIALLRTVVLCATAFGLVLAGARLRRSAMIHAAYATLGAGAAKLIFEDLRHGRMEFIAASIVLVALTLMAVPRLAGRLRRSA